MWAVAHRHISTRHALVERPKGAAQPQQDDPLADPDALPRCHWRYGRRPRTRLRLVSL